MQDCHLSLFLPKSKLSSIFPKPSLDASMRFFSGGSEIRVLQSHLIIGCKRFCTHFALLFNQYFHDPLIDISQDRNPHFLVNFCQSFHQFVKFWWFEVSIEFSPNFGEIFDELKKLEFLSDEHVINSGENNFVQFWFLLSPNFGEHFGKLIKLASF